jgi:hypothetical protein
MVYFISAIPIWRDLPGLDFGAVQADPAASLFLDGPISPDDLDAAAIAATVGAGLFLGGRGHGR